MIGKLVTTPLRLYVRTTAEALKLTREAGRFGWHLAGSMFPGGGSAAPPAPRERDGSSGEPSSGNGSARERSAGGPSSRREPGTRRPSPRRPTEPPRDPRRTEPANGSEPVAPPLPPPMPVREEPSIDLEAPAPLVEAHVDAGAELVDERADPGAEDGAGAQIHVDEPWPGYAELKIPDVLDRVASANAAELAAMRLYEGTHRRRERVLAAIDKKLGLTN